MHPDRTLALRDWLWSVSYRIRLRLIWVFDIVVAVVALIRYRLVTRRTGDAGARQRPMAWAYLLAGMVIGATAQMALQYPRNSAYGDHPALTEGAAWDHPALEGMNTPAGNTGEIAMALARMTPRELSLTYARIHSVFEAALTDGEFNTAGELLNYAALTERELLRRNIARPVETASVAEMRILLDVIR
jgi:hypothetical protein